MKRTAYALIAVIPWCPVQRSALNCAACPIRNPHSAIGIQNSATRIPQSAVRTARIMLLDGESGGPYHRWQVTTPVLKAMLDETNLFSIDVATAPATTAELNDFRPGFERYRAVVLNYDAPDDRWPADLKSAFEQFVRQGGGVVMVHGADNAFPHWKAYNDMTGVGGWRGRNEGAGPHWFVKDGRAVSDDRPGQAGSHGARLPFVIRVREANHPITRGLPAAWMHQSDELYASLRGPGQNMTVLATAYSDPANQGTGVDEPELMALRYGSGRVFHTTLGHDVNGMSSVDFVTTFQRGVEWVATGDVTQQVSTAFPTVRTVSYRADLAAMDPINRNGLDPLDRRP